MVNVNCAVKLVEYFVYGRALAGYGNLQISAIYAYQTRQGVKSFSWL